MSTCPQCQTRFECGVVDNGAPAACWCMALPRAPKPGKTAVNEELIGKSCLCQTCLTAMRSAQAATD